MAIEIVDLPTENADCPVRYVNVYQRVTGLLFFQVVYCIVVGFNLGTRDVLSMERFPILSRPHRDASMIFLTP